MKKSGLMAVIFAVIFALMIPTASAAQSFTDVSKDFWAADEIYRFTDEGVINGYDDGTFRPNKPVTRAQAAIILARGLDLDTENPKPVDYKDINKNFHAYNEIAAITEAGIMQGNKGKFQPNKPLTRAQMAIIIANAFELEGNNSASFKDVKKSFYAYKEIDAILAYQITTGYEDHTFQPFKPTTRAQFVTFLARALDNVEDGPLADFLKEVYANEVAIETYEYEGNMDLGINLPDSLKNDPEAAGLVSLLEDIQIDISGTYQKDPMVMEANLDLTLKGEVDTTFSMPMVMTEDKMWMQLPQSPLFPLPEDVDGKFIEFDYEELAELQGQPMAPMNMNLQNELGLAINNLFLDDFANQYYKVVDPSEVEIPSDVDAETVVKFELTNESLEPFVKTLITSTLPQLVELLEDPEYAEALGLTAEDVALFKEQLALINIDEVLVGLNSTFSINAFDEYVFINEDDYIVYDVMDLDVDFKMEEEKLGLSLLYDLKKSNINGDVEVSEPNKADVITYAEFMEIMEAEMQAEIEAAEVQ